MPMLLTSAAKFFFKENTSNLCFNSNIDISFFASGMEKKNTEKLSLIPTPNMEEAGRSSNREANDQNNFSEKVELSLILNTNMEEASSSSRREANDQTNVCNCK
ncbi:hypothetical protein WN943_006032 [Citrus x changshan-huyou]